MLPEVSVRTNNHWRHFVYGCELSPEERAEFDYIDDIDTHSFIRYKGNVIDPSEFMVITDTMKLHDSWNGLDDKWHGYMSDSFFSGLLIRYSDDTEEYQIATYVS